MILARWLLCHAVLLLHAVCATAKGELKPFALATMNNTRHFAHQSGSPLLLLPGTRTTIRLCPVGSLRHIAMLPSAHTYTPVRGCEVLTMQCQCYRWEFSFPSIPDTTGPIVQVVKETNFPQCAMVTITTPSERAITPTPHAATVNLTWVVAQYNKILTLVQEQRLRESYLAWGGLRSYPFFYFRQVNTDLMCPENSDVPSGVDESAKIVHSLPIVVLWQPFTRYDTDIYTLVYVLTITIFAMFGWGLYVFFVRPAHPLQSIKVVHEPPSASERSMPAATALHAQSLLYNTGYAYIDFVGPTQSNAVKRDQAKAQQKDLYVPQTTEQKPQQGLQAPPAATVQQRQTRSSLAQSQAVAPQEQQSVVRQQSLPAQPPPQQHQAIVDTKPTMTTNPPRQAQPGNDVQEVKGHGQAVSTDVAPTQLHAAARFAPGDAQGGGLLASVLRLRTIVKRRVRRRSSQTQSGDTPRNPSQSQEVQGREVTEREGTSVEDERERGESTDSEREYEWSPGDEI